jgi:hypothetical protein
MKLAKRLPGNAAWMGLSLLLALLPLTARAISTTTVQGTLYRADGGIAEGTVLLSWPAFTTAANEAVAAGSKTIAIGSDGWVSVALASNYGATPDGTYYTAVLHLSDGSTSTEYWLVPTTATADIGGVRTQVVPAYVAARSVNKQYVDTAMAAYSAGLIPETGGTMSGPLTLNGDPVAAQQATTKHYVDQAVMSLLPLTGGTLTGPINLAGDPTTATQAATKHYVDTVVLPESRVTNLAADLAAKASLAGPNFTSPTATADPTAALGLATKQYVDAHAGADATKVPLAGGTMSGALNLNATPDYTSPSLQAATKQLVLNHGEISVTDYGAVGDGVTDNRAAFNAAVLAAKAGGKSLFVPAGNYFLSDAIDYRSVSMRGVPGLGGLGTFGSTLIGAACHDILATPESADTGISQVANDYWKISDLTVIVDASLDATAQFNSVVNTSGTTVTWVSGSKFACLINGPGTPTVRINGTTYNVSGATDTTITLATSAGTQTNATLWSAGTFVNRKRWALQRSAFANNPAAWTGQTLGATKSIGATTITLATAPTLNSSWGVAANGAVQIGSNVCNYYGIVGAVLQNVTCGMQGTTDVAGNSGDAVTPVNPWLYTDTADDLPGAEVGNVAFAYPQRDADHSLNNIAGTFHENIRVIAGNVVGNQANNTGGWFTQILPYAAHFKNLMARGTTFGFIEAQNAVDIDQQIRGQGTQDAAIFEGFEMHTPVPFVGVSGDFVSINNFQLYSGTYDGVKVPSRGLILLEPTDPNCSGCLFKNLPMGGWTIRNMYNEPGYTGTYYGPYAQIQGGTMQFHGGMMGSQPGPVIWDAVASETHSTSLTSGAVPAMIITGTGNKFHNAGMNTTAGEVVDNSQGGTEWDGIQYYGIKDVFQVPARFGPANRIDEAFLRTMSFGSDAYQSGHSLFVSPENLVNWLNVGTQYIVHDSTAPVTGQYLVLPAHPGVDLLGRINGYDAWRVGTTFPMGTGTIVIKARPKATTSGTLQVTANGVAIGSATCNLTVSIWNTCTVRYDSTTATPGGQVKLIGAWNGTDNAFSPATEIDVAYVAAVPDFNTVYATTANLTNVAATNATVSATPTTPTSVANKAYTDSTVLALFPAIPSTAINDSWPMHEGSGTTFAEASGLNSVTAVGGGSWGAVAGFTGSTYTFNGTTGYATAANQTTTNFDGTTPFSYSARIRPSALTTAVVVSSVDTASNSTGWQSYIDGSGYLYLSIINNAASNQLAVRTSTGGIAANSTSLVTVTYDGSRTPAGVKFYVNGAALSNFTVANTLTGSAANTKTLTIGAKPDGTTPFNGAIGDVVIYNTTLTAKQVAALYSGFISESQVTNLTNDLALKAPLISPSFTTPSLGAATATSINKLTLAPPATSATLSIADGQTLTTSGAYAAGLTFPGAYVYTLPAATGTLADLASTQTLTNKTLDGVSAATMAFVDPTSSIQTQLNGKAPLSSPSFTTQATAPKFIGVIASETDVTYSATPTFVATSNLNYISLTGNVTSSTLAAGANGQTINVVICQDSTGSRTFVWPSSVRGGGTIGSAASTCSSQRFTYVAALAKWVSAGAIQTGL